MQKYRVVMLDGAENDLLSLYAFIARDSLYYAEKVMNSITDWCEKILSIAPEIGHVLDEEKMIREVTESTYGYIVRFQIQGDTVYVLMVYKWQLRG